MKTEETIPALPAEPKKKSARFGAALLRVLFPPRCVFCGRRGEASVCTECARQLHDLLPPEGEPQSRLRSSWMHHAVAVWQYDGIARHALLLLKRYASRWRAAEIARQLAVTAAAAKLPAPDLIIPVPNYEKGAAEQTNAVPRLLAERLSQAFGAPMEENILIKAYPTSAQHRLSRLRRTGNPVGAYRVRSPQCLQGKTVWLVDDIVTSGATMSECARLLWLYGAQQVVGLCYCVTVSRKPEPPAPEAPSENTNEE